jgi:hypothetical protein
MSRPGLGGTKGPRNTRYGTTSVGSSRSIRAHAGRKEENAAAASTAASFAARIREAPRALDPRYGIAPGASAKLLTRIVHVSTRVAGAVSAPDLVAARGPYGRWKQRVSRADVTTTEAGFTAALFGSFGLLGAGAGGASASTGSPPSRIAQRRREDRAADGASGGRPRARACCGRSSARGRPSVLAGAGRRRSSCVGTASDPIRLAQHSSIGWRPARPVRAHLAVTALRAWRAALRGRRHRARPPHGPGARRPPSSPLRVDWYGSSRLKSPAAAGRYHSRRIL